MALCFFFLIICIFYFHIIFFIYLYYQKFILIGMNEDGSFIGQYGRKGKNPDSNAQAFATLV